MQHNAHAVYLKVCHCVLIRSMVSLFMARVLSVHELGACKPLR